MFSLRTIPCLTALLCACTALSAQELAITFDDLPAHGPLPPGETRLQVAQSILDTIHREHLPKVYGFVNGLRTVDAPASTPVLDLWHNAKEPLGNHTWSHPDLNTLTAEQFLAEVDQDTALLQRYDHRGDTRWLRYPFLHEGDTVEKHRAVRAGLAARGYRVAEVTLDFEDYLWNEPYARCTAKGDTAALQYLHDSYLASAEQYVAVARDNARQTFHRDIPYILLLHIGAFDAKMLPELLALYRRDGFRFVSLPRANKDKAYRTDPDSGDTDGGSLTELIMTVQDLQPIENSKPYEKLAALCQ